MSFTHAPAAIVVDASVAVEVVMGNNLWLTRWTAWTNENSLLLAPFHFTAEVADALLRSARLSAAEVNIYLDRLARSGIESTGGRATAMREAVTLAEQHGLTVYDALYLQLALDVDGELATLDKDLRRAAKAEGVALI